MAFRYLLYFKYLTSCSRATTLKKRGIIKLKKKQNKKQKTAMLKDEANNTVSESYARAKVAFLYPL